MATRRAPKSNAAAPANPGMQPPEPRVSVVIRTFNEEQHIGKLLRGIQNQTLAPDVEVIVVDSGSTDGTVDVARPFGVRLVNITPEEFSFGRALNRGIAVATAPFVVIASAHVYPVYNDWLERMIAPFSNERIAVTYGKQRGCETTQYSEHQIVARWFPDRSVRVQETPFCNNANSAIRRSLWAETPYDEELTGLEDLAWARIMFERGLRVSYVAEAEIIHVHNEPANVVLRRYEREAIAFRRIYPEQTMSLPGMASLFLQNATSDLVHASREGVLARHWNDILTFRFLQFYGAWRGMNEPVVTAQLRERFYYPHNLTARRSEDDHERQKHRIRYESDTDPAP
jgi:glycosyltransferase involved in cell wall biosynthesis